MPAPVALTVKVVLAPAATVCVVVGVTLKPAPAIVQLTVPGAVAAAALLNTKARVDGKVKETAPAGVTGVIVGAPTAGQAVGIAPKTWPTGVVEDAVNAAVVVLNEP